MDNENPNSAETSTPSEKPPRSKLERAVVWTLIGVLLVITGLEASARTGYAKTLEDLEKAIEETEKPLTLNDFNAKLKRGLTIQTKGEREGQPTMLFKWPSLVKSYELHLTVTPDQDQVLLTYSTGDGPAALIGVPSPPGEAWEDSGSDDGPGPPPQAEDGGEGTVGRGRQGGGRRGGRNPLQQLLSEPVLAELELSEEQKTQLQDLVESQQLDPSLSPEERAQQQETQRQEILQQLKGFLNEQQFTRARQILLQAQGVEALAQEDVAEELQLSLEQREQIASIVESQREKQQALFQQAQNGEIERDEIREKTTALREEMTAQVLAVLTAEQKQAWETLLGPAPPAAAPRSRSQRPE